MNDNRNSTPQPSSPALKRSRITSSAKREICAAHYYVAKRNKTQKCTVDLCGWRRLFGEALCTEWQPFFKFLDKSEFTRTANNETRQDRIESIFERVATLLLSQHTDTTQLLAHAEEFGRVIVLKVLTKLIMNPIYERFPLYSNRTSLCYNLAYDGYLDAVGNIRMFNLTGNRWIHDPNKDLQEQTFGVFLTLFRDIALSSEPKTVAPIFTDCEIIQTDLNQFYNDSQYVEPIFGEMMLGRKLNFAALPTLLNVDVALPASKPILLVAPPWFVGTMPHLDGNGSMLALHHYLDDLELPKIKRLLKGVDDNDNDNDDNDNDDNDNAENEIDDDNDENEMGDADNDEINNDQRVQNYERVYVYPELNAVGSELFCKATGAPLVSSQVPPNSLPYHINNDSEWNMEQQRELQRAGIRPTHTMTVRPTSTIVLPANRHHIFLKGATPLQQSIDNSVNNNNDNAQKNTRNNTQNKSKNITQFYPASLIVAMAGDTVFLSDQPQHIRATFHHLIQLERITRDSVLSQTDHAMNYYSYPWLSLLALFAFVYAQSKDLFGMVDDSNVCVDSVAMNRLLLIQRNALVDEFRTFVDAENATVDFARQYIDNNHSVRDQFVRALHSCMNPDKAVDEFHCTKCFVPVANYFLFADQDKPMCLDCAQAAPTATVFLLSQPRWKTLQGLQALLK